MIVMKKALQLAQTYLSSQTPGSAHIQEDARLELLGLKGSEADMGWHAQSLLMASINRKDHVMTSWLLENSPNIELHANNEAAFQLACEVGCPKTMKALIDSEADHGRIDIHAEEDQPWINAVASGKPEAMDFMLQLEKSRGRIDKHSQNSLAFRSVNAFGLEYGNMKKLLEVSLLEGNMPKGLNSPERKLLADGIKEIQAENFKELQSISQRVKDATRIKEHGLQVA